MSRKKVSAEKQLEVRINAKKKLEQLERIQLDKNTVRLLDNFKNKYNCCETVYKEILLQHKKWNKKDVSDYLKVSMREAPSALDFAGYMFDRKLINELFGSESKRGKTVKKLRDAVTHDINSKAVTEIKLREKELFRYMEEFLNTIRTFDEVSTEKHKLKKGKFLVKS